MLQGNSSFMRVYSWPRCGNSQAPAVYFSAATLQRARQGKAEEVVCTGCMCIRQVHGTQYCWHGHLLLCHAGVHALWS